MRRTDRETRPGRGDQPIAGGTTNRPSGKTAVDRRVERRGLLAATAAAVAALVARFSEAPLEAGMDGDVVLGASNSAATQTSITNTSPGSTATVALALSSSLSTNGLGLSSQGSHIGVAGFSLGNGVGPCGVFGSGSDAAYGVWGNGPGSHGVHGTSISGSGVYGQSTSGTAILGEVPAFSSANTIAIYGLNTSTFAGGAPGAGGFAIYGLSAKGHGLVGATAAAGAAAVVGATNGVPGAYAAAFYGPVVVAGDFTVVGGAKSAAVPHPDGSHRRLYCTESPESWFEDFGTGNLDCGRAEVTIDPDFAAIADLTDYHVFLTDYDTDSVLRVRRRTPAGFAVEADSAIAALTGRSERELSGRFGWRLVAKRKDIRGERLATVTIPREPALPAVPDPAPSSSPLG
jgi:hypothetical protein